MRRLIVFISFMVFFGCKGKQSDGSAPAIEMAMPRQEVAPLSRQISQSSPIQVKIEQNQ